MSIKIIIYISFSLQLITESVYNLLWDNHYLSFNKNKIIISDKFNLNQYFKHPNKKCNI